jgi:AraC-like DNA-binding protein
MALTPQRSPEQIEAMRRQIFGEGKTYEEVGKLFGLSRARVWQLVGPRGSEHSRRKAKREKALELHEAGKSATEIAHEIGVATAETVRRYLRESGIELSHGNRSHNQEHTIWCARQWKKQFGYTPSGMDWNPAQAKREGLPDLAERFYKFRQKYGCPNTATVQELFGSWSEMIRRAGFKPAPQGSAARGRRERKFRSKR